MKHLGQHKLPSEVKQLKRIKLKDMGKAQKVGHQGLDLIG